MIGLRTLAMAISMVFSLIMASGAQASFGHHRSSHHGHHYAKVKVVHVKAAPKAYHHVRHAHAKPKMHAPKMHAHMPKKHHHHHHYAHHRAAPKPPAIVLVKAGHPGKCGTYLYYSAKVRGCADARAKA
jgi:hypothetical protein